MANTKFVPICNGISGLIESCPAPVVGTGEEFVDVRDLFLPPVEAVFYGGSGTEP